MQTMIVLDQAIVAFQYHQNTIISLYSMLLFLYVFIQLAYGYINANRIYTQQ